MPSLEGRVAIVTGANTGIGGVIRDPMGTGLGAKPFCNTDIFCFAPPDTPSESLPPGVLHPRRVIKGVVSGVRDYGNRMGIPTVNGANATGRNTKAAVAIPRGRMNDAGPLAGNEQTNPIMPSKSAKPQACITRGR